MMAPPPESDALGIARAAYDARDWTTAIAGFEEAGGFDKLELADVERLAWARVWTLAPAADCLDAFERLEAAAARESDGRRAARAALEQARMHAMLDNTSLARSSWQRGVRQLGDEECPETALGLALAALGDMVGDAEATRALAEQALDAARRVGDATSEAIALEVLGRLRCLDGDVDQGLEMVDQAMSMATSGGVHPLYAGAIACGAVSLCRTLGDWERARQWNELADRFCARESVCHYPGHCSVFRAELIRESGDFAMAAHQAVQALEQAGDWSRSWTGLAYHQLGEARVCLGDLEGARDAFMLAAEHGCDPQPGQARLLAAQGHHDAALRQIERFLAGDGSFGSDHVLPVLYWAVTIAIEGGQQEVAHSLSSQLDGLAARAGTPASATAARQAQGELALAAGNADLAAERLRASVRAWGQLNAPYHAARARVLLARALDSLDHGAEADLEREVAAGVFERLGAVLDLRQLRRPETTAAAQQRRTFSFTDIVGSSELVTALGDEGWGQVLHAHDRHLRQLLVDHGGSEVKHEGDGLFVSFDSESAAVRWAVAVQQRLHEQRREHGFAPHIRIGVHCGQAMRYGDDFIGRCIHETARIANAAGADQIFVSARLAEQLGDGFRVSATHTLELKGFAEPHPVVEIDWRSTE